MVGRERLDAPCDQIVNKAEWRVMSAWATGNIADTAPSAQQATRWIGKLGGWPEKNKTILAQPDMWRGLVRLPTMVQGYLLALQVHGIRAGP